MATCLQGTTVQPVLPRRWTRAGRPRCRRHQSRRWSTPCPHRADAASARRCCEAKTGPVWGAILLGSRTTCRHRQVGRRPDPTRPRRAAAPTLSRFSLSRAFSAWKRARVPPWVKREDYPVAENVRARARQGRVARIANLRWFICEARGLPGSGCESHWVCGLLALTTYGDLSANAITLRAVRSALVSLR
jgi:hypothetical protein